MALARHHPQEVSKGTGGSERPGCSLQSLQLSLPLAQTLQGPSSPAQGRPSQQLLLRWSTPK